MIPYPKPSPPIAGLRLTLDVVDRGDPGEEQPRAHPDPRAPDPSPQAFRVGGSGHELFSNHPHPPFLDVGVSGPIAIRRLGLRLSGGGFSRLPLNPNRSDILDA